MDGPPSKRARITPLATLGPVTNSLSYDLNYELTEEEALALQEALATDTALTSLNFYNGLIDDYDFGEAGYRYS